MQLSLYTDFVPDARDIFLARPWLTNALSLPYVHGGWPLSAGSNFDNICLAVLNLAVDWSQFSNLLRLPDSSSLFCNPFISPFLVYSIS